MKRLIRPLLFSERFGLSPKVLDEADLIDPILNCDTLLFVDPILVPKTANAVIARDGAASLDKRLQDIMRLASLSRAEGDAAWKGALRLIDLDEVPETCLGYGSTGTSGSDRSQGMRRQLLRTTQEVLRLGIDDPEAIALMSFLDEGIGPDTISDLTCNAIKKDLARLTQDFCHANEIATEVFRFNGEVFHLPVNPAPTKRRSILLVPKDLVRELPVAADWSDIDRVVAHNLALRAELDRLLGDYAKATVTEKKRAIRETALRSAGDFLRVFEQIFDGEGGPYDWLADDKGLEGFRKALLEFATAHPLAIRRPRETTEAELRRVVDAIVQHFSQLIENNDLSYLLWNGSQPRHEKAAQLLFYGIAEAYCKANNLDISPETNQGGGPVDFKFSKGRDCVVLVELKLSTGRVVHGFSRQLEAYKAASHPFHAILLVVKVGTEKQLQTKLASVKKISDSITLLGDPVSEVIVVDATRKPSASKR